MVFHLSYCLQQFYVVIMLLRQVHRTKNGVPALYTNFKFKFYLMTVTFLKHCAQYT